MESLQEYGRVGDKLSTKEIVGLASDFATAKIWGSDTDLCQSTRE